jgi:hypothetical protein
MEREPEVEEEEEEERLEETIDTNEINRSPMFFARFTPREPKTKRATKSIKNPRGLRNTTDKRSSWTQKTSSKW